MEEFYYDDITFNDSNKDLMNRPGKYEFIECHFEGLDLRELNFRNFKFVDCHFSHCNFNNMNLSSSAMRSSTFKECRLVGINWCSLETFMHPKFYDCQLDYGVFQGLKLPKAEFSKCSLKEVDLSEAVLTEGLFDNSDLEGASFNKADLSKADFTAAKNYSIDPRFTNIKKAQFSMPEAMSLLRALDIVIR
jgi:fluoroquinolone resistance protein